jgi:iron complex transport system ATP-binding protein
VNAEARADRPADGSERGLCLSGVSVSLGGRQVLAEIDMAVEPGEVVGLVGPNGAGKSTLLRLASRVLEPAAGEVRFAARPLADYSRRELSRRISVVPQDTTIPFPFRAGELVVMGRAPHQPMHGFDSGEDIAQAHDALRRVGIVHLAERSVFELSGGERQLVAFARALAQDADLILLDEPTAFLDLRHRVQVLTIVRELAAQGRAALVVSHDLNLVARACDRLEVLSAGRLIARGPPSEVVSEALLEEAYGVEADVLRGPDGTPVVVPRVGR